MMHMKVKYRDRTNIRFLKVGNDCELVVLSMRIKITIAAIISGAAFQDNYVSSYSSLAQYCRILHQLSIQENMELYLIYNYLPAISPVLRRGE
jgi:hypothetical protein